VAQGRGGRAPDEFERLHRLFVQHLGIALGLVWLSTAVAASMAPWTRNIRGLIDPFGRPESTGSFLLALPMIMTLAWIAAVFGGDLLRRSQLFRNQLIEFGLAGLVAFAIFCLAISRAVTAISLGQ
jgi:hypothetical protein